MSRQPGATREHDAIPDLSGEDEVHSEPTKVGDNAVVIREAFRAALDAPPAERATSKMSPFQLEDVLQRLGDSPDKSQARVRAPSLPPTAEACERATIPGPIPSEVVPVAPMVPVDPAAAVAPEVDDLDRPTRVAPPAPPIAEERTGGVSIGLVLLAAAFFVLTCGVLFGR